MNRAFVLGAGLGTRLKTLTERRPKPLIPIHGKPLITFVFDQLIAAGIGEIVVNSHHCHEEYERAFPDGIYRGARLIFEYEPVLLETAGGIKNVERHMGGEAFLVYNGDVLTNVPVEKAIEHHQCSGNEVTMVLRISWGAAARDIGKWTGGGYRGPVGGGRHPVFVHGDLCGRAGVFTPNTGSDKDFGDSVVHGDDQARAKAGRGGAG